MTEPTEDPTPPERGWLFRRIFTYAATLLNCGGVGFALARLDDPESLRWIALALIGSNIVLATLYLAGATVTDWAKLAAAARPGIKIGRAPARTEAVDDGELPPDQRVRR